MTKEQAYDEFISPLMGEIIAHCREHKIPLIANFRIHNDDDPNLVCTTALLREEYDPTDNQLRARDALYSGAPKAFAMSIVTTEKK